MNVAASSRSSRAPDPARVVVQASIDAWVDLFDAVGGRARERLGLEARPLDGGTLLLARGIDHMMLNRLVLAPPTAAAHAAAVYQEHGVRRFLLSFARDEVEAASAAASGVRLARFRRAWEVLAAPTVELAPRPPCPSGVTIRPAGLGDAPAVAGLLCDGFDLPPAAASVLVAAIERPRWTVLVADDGNEPVAAGLAFHGEAACYLFAASTRPSHRGRGIQTALIDGRIQAALAERARIVGSETGVAIPGEANPSWHNLARAGLRSVHVTEHLCPIGATWAAA